MVELTKEELRMVTALSLMHDTGMILAVHETHRPTLRKLAEKLSMANIENNFK